MRARREGEDWPTSPFRSRTWTFEANDDGCLDTIMQEFEQKNSKLIVAEAAAELEEEVAE
jgi:hypothetical protein